jgi:sugar phosphate isomerase/epimerase
MYRRFIFLIATLLAAVPAGAAEPLPNPFFVFDNGTGRDQNVTLEEQANLVKRRGYAGIGFTGARRIPEILKALDERGLKLFSIYVAAHVDGDGLGFDSALPEAIAQLKGRETVLWLTVQGKAADGDLRAVVVLRKIADLAAASGLRVVLYPHAGFYVQRIEDALRVRKLADRPNVGVSFNLAHFLAMEDQAHLDQQLKDALPFLQMVSVNGADQEGDWRSGDWSHLIQPLDKGKFDNRALLQKLHSLGYHGPIGLQCYHVPGDVEENLKRSMAAWHLLTAQL